MVYVLTQDMLLIHYNLEQKKRHFYQHINSNTHRSSSVVRLLIALLAKSNFSEQTDRQKENPKMDGHDSEDSSKQSTADMTAFVQNLLQQMVGFLLASVALLLGRINELEQSINDLRAEMGVEGTPPPPSKSGDEPKTPADST
ncbi:hypothetical protein IGI04_030843 [Brassica rapa subsp. trilocularis]|uniref:Heat shock factor binding protein n=1 Tax=Brassica rapa subsp. trilocularis TaxID=1813537 RepID=A0ABQ7LRX1_BRACM|nr:hypothetical protein IGI04_030843 [Brassica rapa subsp. trilocularis]